MSGSDEIPRVQGPDEDPRVQDPDEDPRVEDPDEDPRVEDPDEDPRVQGPDEDPRVEDPDEDLRIDIGTAELRTDFATAIPDLQAVCATDGTILAGNPACHRILGWEEAELVGRRLATLSHPHDRPVVQKAFRGVVDAGTPILDLESRCRTRAGDWRWISWSAAPSAQGDRVVIAGRDVTRRTEEHLATKMNETLLANAERIGALGSWEWDPTGGPIRCSAELRRILALEDGQEITFESFQHWLGPADRERLRATVGAAVAEARGYTIEYTAHLPGRSERILLERGEPYLQGQRLVRFVGTIQDVTEQRRVESDLRRALRVEQEATDRLRHLDQLKNSFLGAVSHELRTPLTVLRGFAQTLQQHDDELDPGTRRRIQDALVDHSTRLGDLVTDLLDLNRLLRSGELDTRPDPIDLGALLAAVVAERPNADRVRLHVTGPVEVAVDPLHAERILVNLLDNCDKYAPTGPLVLRVTHTALDRVRLEVRDHGPGIPAEALDRIFEPFYRVDQDHPQPGTGVGLALVAEFARLHGGRAWAENPPDGGALIVVELPVPDAVPGADGQAPAGLGPDPTSP